MRLMPRTRWGVAWRGLLALVIVVGCAAGATATAGLLQLKQVVNDLNLSKPLPTKQLTPPAPGEPETLLLIGVDCRGSDCKDGNVGNTDTMMLVRIDDSSTTINALSIPRDLGVQIPGFGYGKINSAYTDGGESLLIKTMKADLLPQLQVNHVLIVDFTRFANLINAIGCVYAQVDHRYYNKNVGTIPTEYSGIDIQPGYQKLCGGSGSNLGGPNTALAFVRFRHNDSDFVRQSRQQDFLRWAKQNFSSGQLLSEKDELLRYFGEDVQTDKHLHSTAGVDELFGLAFNADGSALKSIPFPDDGDVGNTTDLAFNPTAVQQAYNEFITPTSSPAGATTTAGPPPTTPTTTSRRHKGHKRAHVYVPPVGMTADVDDGTSQSAHLGSPGLPVYYPKDVPDNFVYCFALTGNCNIYPEPASAYAASYPRHYSIIGTDGKRYPSYVMTLVASSGGISDTGTGEYATVQGTTWPGAGHEAGPPILRSPSGYKVVNNKVLYLYSQAGNLTIVAWKTHKAVYWISNTLQNNIPNPQMIAMAASLTHAA
jgi:polyisoprenyl-teichoic acid--peptidoglycan teichoic acid transferase